MMISSKGRYALRVMIDLAEHADEGYIPLQTIAARQGISEKYLESILAVLSKARLLDAVRGKGGGLRLADDPEKINIGAVVRHLEPMQVVECMGDNNECLITPSCRLTGIITGAIKAFFNHLDQYSLRDLLDKPTYDILYTPRIPINEIRRMVD